MEQRCTCMFPSLVSRSCTGFHHLKCVELRCKISNAHCLLFGSTCSSSFARHRMLIHYLPGRKSHTVLVVHKLKRPAANPAAFINIPKRDCHICMYIHIHVSREYIPNSDPCANALSNNELSILSSCPC